MPEMKNQTVIAAIILAVGSLVAAFVAGQGTGQQEQTVSVNGSGAQPESLSIKVAGERIERLSKEVATAEARIKELEGDVAGKEKIRAALVACQESKSGSVGSGDVARDDANPPPDSGWGPEERISKNFVFSLQRCEAAGTRVTCHFSIANNGEDRSLLLLARSVRWGTSTFLFDSLGSKHSAVEALLGRSGAPGLDTIPDIDYPANVSFQGVPRESEMIPKLDIGFVIEGSGINRLVFRQVPIVRK